MPKSPRQSDTAFAIVLFTDMVGSTAIASELGDRRWRVLQAKHHSVIRSELRKHGGREIDTAGDGFFARSPRAKQRSDAPARSGTPSWTSACRSAVA